VTFVNLVLSIDTFGLGSLSLKTFRPFYFIYCFVHIRGFILLPISSWCFLPRIGLVDLDLSKQTFFDSPSVRISNGSNGCRDWSWVVVASRLICLAHNTYMVRIYEVFIVHIYAFWSSHLLLFLLFLLFVWIARHHLFYSCLIWWDNIRDYVICWWLLANFYLLLLVVQHGLFLWYSRRICNELALKFGIVFFWSILISLRVDFDIWKIVLCINTFGTGLVQGIGWIVCTNLFIFF